MPMLLFKIDYSLSLNLPQNDAHELMLTMELHLDRFPPPATANIANNLPAVPSYALRAAIMLATVFFRFVTTSLLIRIA